MALSPEDLVDLSILVRDRWMNKNGSWTDISLSHRKYKFTEFLKAGGKDNEDGGVVLKFPLQIANVETARNTGIYDVDTTAPKNISAEGTLNWSMQTVNYIYDRNESVFQADDITIVNYLQKKLHSAFNAYFELQERNMLGCPTSTSQEKPPPNGFEYWFPVDTSTPAGDFSDAYPTGHTAIAGLDKATYSGWRHWAFGYYVVSWDDFVEKLLEATEMTHFMSPHLFPKMTLGGDGEPKWMFLTTRTVKNSLRKLLRESNDNIGDLAAHNRQLLSSVPLESWPYLETATTDHRIYGINFNHFKYKFCRGRNMKWDKPIQKAGSHTVMEHHMDNTGQYVVDNLREAGFVGSKIAA